MLGCHIAGFAGVVGEVVEFRRALGMGGRAFLRGTEVEFTWPLADGHELESAEVVEDVMGWWRARNAAEVG